VVPFAFALALVVGDRLGLSGGGAGVSLEAASLSRTTDAALVQRYRQGDAKAFELLVARHSRFAGAVAMGVVADYHAALDVVQEAFVKVLEGLAQLEDPERFQAWLRHVVRSTSLDHLRRRKVTGRAAEALPGQDDESEPLPAPALAPEDLLEQAELRAQVREEISALPESQREVVYLKYLEGMSYEEIADVTGLTINTIESRLFRARASLRKRLAERFGEEGPSRPSPAGKK
jgi:RNA polymerase sigma-70 factor (ECF subfamily)